MNIMVNRLVGASPRATERDPSRVRKHAVWNQGRIPEGSPLSSVDSGAHGSKVDWHTHDSGPRACARGSERGSPSWRGWVALTRIAVALAALSFVGAPACADGAADAVAAMSSKSLPPGAKEIVPAIKSAKPGDTITIRGRVAPAKDAFAKDSAVVTIVDESADAGRFPVGKELPATLGTFPAGAKATVQFVDAGGQPLRTGLDGKHGLLPGGEVFIVGKVASANGVDVLVVNATGFHVPKGALPAGFFVDAPKEGARDLSDVRAQGGLKVGDEVLLRGRIGGGMTPFVDGRAMVTLMGSKLKPCNENPGDHCKTPWDVCCDPKELIRANIATIQIVDAKGQPLRTDLKGRRNLKELSEIVVLGKVASVEGNTLVVNATAINVVKP